MQEIVDYKKCSGCYACFNICPNNCILMQSDNEGFLRPVVDSDRCVECGLCQKVCPILKEYKGNPKGKAYACINKDDEVRESSSSGGVFSLLAEHILNQGGVVFGAAFDENLDVHHIGITDISVLEKLRGSKYLQSRIENTYKEAKKQLEAGKKVLFTGTPCQISGLKAYLRKDYENLYTQDLICHGVPSPDVWQKYLKFREEIAGASRRRVFFRYKKDSWKMYSVLLDFENNTKYTSVHYRDLYMRSFLSDLCLRPSCYDCYSKSVERQSDITLADFWGIEKVCPELFDDKGASLVLVNSLKGHQLFSEISSQMCCKEVDIDEALKSNPAAYRSATRPKNRERFMEMVKHYPFDYTVKSCIPARRFRRILSKLKRILCRILSIINKSVHN